MKNIIILFSIAILYVNSLIAQDHKKNRENFRAYKTAYITEKLDLSQEEAEKFWPIYNNYEKNSFNLRIRMHKEIRNNIKEEGGIDAIEDAKVNQYITSLLHNEQEYVSLKKKFYKDLKNILPAKKILKLYNTEGEFNRKVLSEFRKKKHKKTE